MSTIDSNAPASPSVPITASFPAPPPDMHDGPPPTVHEQALSLRGRLIKDPGFRERYLSGDVDARRQMQALDSIRISPANADAAALAKLAEQAGIVTEPRPA